MRLERLTLRHFRGTTDRTVHFADGITVVEGPNEVGKSSLPEALDLLLTYRSDSRAQAVAAAKPVGRDEGPEVEVELTSGPYRLRYAKRWLRRPMTELEVLAPAHEQLSGRAAHDRVRAILDETLDAELWAALRVDQGRALEGSDLGGSATLADALDRAAGRGADPAAGGPLVVRVQEAYEVFHTPGRGARKQDSLAERRHADAVRAELDQAEQQLRDAEADVTAHAALDQQLAAAEAALPALQTAVAAARQGVHELASLREAADRARVDADRATELAEAAEGRATRREDLVARVGELDARHAELLSQRADAELALAVADADVTTRAEALAGTEEELATATARVSELEDRRAAGHDADRLTQLRADLARLAELEQEAAAARAVLSVGAPSAAQLSALSEAELTLAGARARAEQSATVTVVALRPLEVEGAPIEGMTTEMATGGELPVVLDDERTLRIGDLAELHLRPGADAAERVVAHDEATHHLRDLLAEVDCVDVATARQRADDAVAARARLDSANDEARRLLDGRRGDDLRAEADTLAARLPEPTAAPEAREGQPQDVAAALAETRNAARSSAAAARTQREALAAATTTRSDAASALASARTALASTESERATATAALMAARTETDDETLRAAAVRAGAAAGAARRAASDAIEALQAADAGGRDAALDAAVRRHAAAADHVQELGRRRAALELAIRRAQAVGHAEHAGELAADLEAAEASADRVDRRAAATRLLQQTLSRHRDAAREAWVAPLHREVIALGRTVFGTDFDVVIDDDLQVVSRTMAGDTIPFDDLSVGAQEQLGLVLRLAAARIVAQDGQGVPVLLDDVLGFADPGRLGRMRDLLADVAATAQVVVLTCDADRFAHVPDATVVTLR